MEENELNTHTDPTTNGDSVLGEDVPPPDYGDGAPPGGLWGDHDELVSTVYAYKDKQTQRLKGVTLEFSAPLREMGWIEFPIQTRWSVPTKEQLEKYREKSSSYNSVARAVLTHRGDMQNTIFKNHLKGLCFAPGTEYEQKIELTFDKRGRLSEESFNKINKLHSTVIDVIYARYIEDSALIV